MDGKIPGTNFSFSTSSEFDTAVFHDFSKSLLRNEEALENFKTDPVAQLDKLGVSIIDDGGNLISSKELGQIVAKTTDGPPMQNASVSMIVVAVATAIYY